MIKNQERNNILVNFIKKQLPVYFINLQLGVNVHSRPLRIGNPDANSFSSIRDKESTLCMKMLKICYFDSYTYVNKF